jgi:glycosyltransferase involved in cell wall biosynthesis
MADSKPLPLHVLIVQNQFPQEAHWGGISTFGWFMSSALAREGAHVTVICQSSKEIIEPVQIISDHIQVFRIPGKSPIKGFNAKFLARFLPDKDRWFAINVWQTVKRLQQEGFQFDIVDAADYLGGAAYLLRDKSFSIPVVVTCHTPAFLADEMNEGKSSKALNAHKKVYQLELFALQQAAGVLSPSHRLSNLLAAKTGRPLTDFFTNPYPYPLQRELQSIPKEVAISVPYILFTGRIERRKGIQRLLEAWSQSKYKKDYALVLAGKKTNHFEEFELFATGMSGTRVHFIGHRDREELAWLYRNASLVVLPSEPFENYPYTCIESLAFGAPTLVSDSGGMSEMIVNEENGWIFRTGSTEHLTERIDEILGLPINERIQRGQKAQHTIRRINEPSRIAQRALKYYRRVIEDYS